MVAISSLLAGAVPAVAQPFDLNGARAGQGELSLQNRGYALDHTAGGTQYWWNAGDRECISLYVANGRYQDVGRRSAGDCNLSRGNGKKDNTGAIVAGALAVGILAAAIASSKKKHDNDRYDDDRPDDRTYSPARNVDCYPAQQACYERGRGYSAYWTNREFRYRY
ncbi:hypothetical protein PMI01_01593 [Caulobacter sp. AP07]|nr:hypothetical protein PMI01_01593 [Caulobacter sp. AP07]